MKELKKDLRRFRVVNELLEDIEKDITKSIINENEHIALNVGVNGDLFANEKGFLGFIVAINPAIIKVNEFADLHILKFYYDAYYICSILNDAEFEHFKEEFDKLYQKGQINTILLDKSEEVETCKI